MSGSGDGYELVCLECGGLGTVVSPQGEELPCPACCPDAWDLAVRELSR